MMRINLLPMKAARKQGSARQELMMLAGALAAVVVLLFIWSTYMAGRIDAVQSRVDEIKRDLERVQRDVARVQDFKAKAELLERKLKVIEDLKNKKIGPARMLDDLATILTEERKVWLTKLEERDGRLTLEGGAMEHENVSDFQRALERRSKLFRDIKIGSVSSIKKDGATYLEWKMTCATSYTAG